MYISGFLLLVSFCSPKWTQCKGPIGLTQPLGRWAELFYHPTDAQVRPRLWFTLLQTKKMAPCFPMFPSILSLMAPGKQEGTTPLPYSSEELTSNVLCKHFSSQNPFFHIWFAPLYPWSAWEVQKTRGVILAHFLPDLWTLAHHLTLRCSISYISTAAKSLQLCPILCDPTDGSPPGSPIPGILQARTLEGVAISFSHAWKWKVKVKSLSRVQLLATPWTAAHQAPPSMGFSRQEYWSGVPLPSPHMCLDLNTDILL